MGYGRSVREKEQEEKKGVGGFGGSICGCCFLGNVIGNVVGTGLGLITGRWTQLRGWMEMGIEILDDLCR